MPKTGRSTQPAAERLLSPAFAATTVAMVALIGAAAFESLAIVTIMPTVSAALDGRTLYAVAFAAPLASGVVGMVAAGQWSDRSGPTRPLLTAVALFSLGLVVCGTAVSMPVFAGGRILQGLGGGALTVGLYVVVGLAYPARLRASLFAAFAAAWVLPSLFGPALAALIADRWTWRWVFLAVVAFVAAAALALVPALRGLPRTGSETPTPRSALAWAVLAGSFVLAIDLLGAAGGLRRLLVVVVVAGLVVALRPLLPVGTLRGRRGLPAVILTRGLLPAGFFAMEAYIVFVLQEQWGLGAGRAGLALTAVGVVWAASSQVQARLGPRVSDVRALTVGACLVLVGAVAVWLAVRAHVHPALVIAAYALAGAGMGFGYPRAGVAMLAESSEADRGFNSSALSIADAIGAAVGISVAGLGFAIAGRSGVTAFLAAFGVAVGFAALSVVSARRVAR